MTTVVQKMAPTQGKWLYPRLQLLLLLSASPTDTLLLPCGLLHTVFVL